MGMFSWKCKGCGDELCCPELVRIDDHVGAYNGYGVVEMSEGKSWDVFDRSNPNETYSRCPNAWHQLCWQVARDEAEYFTDKQPPSESAPNQGFGDAQDRFMPPPDTPHPHAKHGWQLGDKFKVDIE